MDVKLTGLRIIINVASPRCRRRKRLGVAAAVGEHTYMASHGAFLGRRTAVEASSSTCNMIE